MDRIAGSTVAEDLFGAGKDGFKDGNKALGILATIVNAAFMNGVQEEMLAVIEALGIVPSSADNAQLWKALQKVIGSNLGVLVVTGNVTLTAADAGKLIVGGSASPFTVTLPLTSTVRDGAKFECVNMNAGAMTIQRQGSTDIINTSQTRTSEVLGTGDSLVVHAKPSLNMWYASGGTNQNTYAAKYAASRNTSGWQTLPSGLIIQWGSTTGVTSASDTTQALPTTFPNASFIVIPSLAHNAGAAIEGYAVGSFVSNSQIRLRTSNASANSVYWIAIGY